MPWDKIALHQDVCAAPQPRDACAALLLNGCIEGDPWMTTIMCALCPSKPFAMPCAPARPCYDALFPEDTETPALDWAASGLPMEVEAHVHWDQWHRGIRTPSNRA